MKIIFIVALLALIQSCGTKVSEAPATPGTSETPEISDCLTSVSYASPVSVTGTATFYKRNLEVTTVGPNVTKLNLSNPIASALPIRYAEVRVVDANGTLVQCGKTNSVGAIKALDGTSTLTISNSAGNYTVQILSRSNHAVSVPGGKPALQLYTSVKSDVITNSVYTLSQTIASSGSGSVNVSLIAYARESESAAVNGGAFNIYNDLVSTYDYLAQNTGTSDLSCLSSKLDVFWKIGFNPSQYIYPQADPSTLGTLSFYDRSGNDLYINGGKLDNIVSEDTDHFDDAVIIHELGHHIENVCGTMESPGGIHYGLYRTDARLAWSEGWGNFFGAHVIKNNLLSINPELVTPLSATGDWLYYLDTFGYSDSVTGETDGEEYIRLNLSKAGNNPESAGSGRYYDKVDAVTHPGEGHFGETSIARSLFKTTNSCASGCTNNTAYFASMWSAFENDTTTGMGNVIYPFRSSARFYNRLNQVFGAMPGDIDSILNTDEAQQRETNAAFTVSGSRVHVPYGIKLVTGSSCTLKIQPRQNSIVNSNLLSDQRYSNHFYYVDLASMPSVTEIRLTPTYVAGTNGVDIDAILYIQDYDFDEDCATYNTSGVCTSPQKTISSSMVRADRSTGNGVKLLQNLNGLDNSNKYLLNVRAYTTNQTILDTTEYSYTLTDQSGGIFLCPAPTF